MAMPKALIKNTNDAIQTHLYYSTMGYMDLSKFKRVYDFLTLTSKPNFTREEYLLWRKNWKAIYAELSETIRYLKIYRGANNIVTKNASISKEDAMTMAASRTYEARYLREMATSFLELNRQSKEYAQIAFEKSKAV